MAPYLFSIIIPHKNIPVLLQRCLASIPVRDDVQTIVVDDNSDESEVDFSHFPGLTRKDTEVYLTKEGRGAGYARNVGLQHASGKWVLFADADDFFTEDLELILDKYRNSDLEVIMFPVRICDSDTLEESALRDQFINDTLRGEQFSLQEKFSRVITPHSKLIRRDFIQRNHLSFEEIPYSNDSMFNVRLSLLASRKYVDLEYVPYALTYRSGSLTTSKNILAFSCRLSAAIRCNKYLKDNGHPELMIQINRYFLKWSALFGRWQVLRTIWVLWKNGFLFYKDCHAFNDSYYNSAYYIIANALIFKR